MSELSTVAIKDGHRGHLPHHSSHGQQHPSSGLSHQLDAERADRISRLAGLERVATARNPGNPGAQGSGGGGGSLTPGGATPTAGPGAVYFDAAGNPALGRERSTVGSASATGSVGARTTWAGSEAGDNNFDRMSESQDMDIDASSVGGMSEEGTASLVGFGEGARTPARQSVIGVGSGPAGTSAKGGTPTGRDARMIDGLTYDPDVVDTTSDLRRANASPSVAEQAERIVRENMNTTSADRMRRDNGPRDLGTFGFE